MKAMKLFVSAVLLLVAITCVSFTDSCDPPVYGPFDEWSPPTTIDEINNAPRILYGKIIKTYPGYEAEYTAKMEVYCILRGEAVPRIVNITGAGFVAGHCTATDLLVGEVYMVPVDRDLQAQGPSFKEPGQIEEILQACRLNETPTYPLGVDESEAEEECPAGLPEGECKEK